MKVTVWNENWHERHHEEAKRVYPNGIHHAIRDGMLALEGDLEIGTATLDQPEHGLPNGVLNATDVLIWWGHAKHKEVSDEIIMSVRHRVLQGMGLIILHSGINSKLASILLGTPGGMRWREAGEKERLWVCNPAHRIARGIGEYFEIPHTEMYGEPFGLHNPEEIVFISWFEGGDVCRSGCCWRVGGGKIFYFRPGHETYPVYFDRNVHRVLCNAVHWAEPEGVWASGCGIRNVPPEKAPERIGQ